MQGTQDQKKPTSDPKISEKDLTLLENIIKEWYTNNSDKLFASKNSNIMKYMRSISKQLDSFRKFNTPSYLYRGISFENDKLKDEALKKMKELGVLKHPTKDYDSWSSSKEVAEDYGKGGGVADGDYVQYACPHCLHKWWVELPN